MGSTGITFGENQSKVEGGGGGDTPRQYDELRSRISSLREKRRLKSVVK
jgi:hypothetical protein